MLACTGRDGVIYNAMEISHNPTGNRVDSRCHNPQAAPRSAGHCRAQWAHLALKKYPVTYCAPMLHKAPEREGVFLGMDWLSGPPAFNLRSCDSR